MGNFSGNLKTDTNLIRLTNEQNTWLKCWPKVHIINSRQQLPGYTLGHTGFALGWAAQKPWDTSSWRCEVCLQNDWSSSLNSVSGHGSLAEQSTYNQRIVIIKLTTKVKRQLCLKRLTYLLLDKTSSIADSKNKVLVRVSVQWESTGRQLEV